MYEAEALWRACLRGDDPRTERAVDALQKIYVEARPGPTTMVLIEAARRRGIPCGASPASRWCSWGWGEPAAAGRRR